MRADCRSHGNTAALTDVSINVSTGLPHTTHSSSNFVCVYIIFFLAEPHNYVYWRLLWSSGDSSSRSHDGWGFIFSNSKSTLMLQSRADWRIDWLEKRPKVLKFQSAARSLIYLTWYIKQNWIENTEWLNTSATQRHFWAPTCQKPPLFFAPLQPLWPHCHPLLGHAGSSAHKNVCAGLSCNLVDVQPSAGETERDKGPGEGDRNKDKEAHRVPLVS